MLRLIPRPKIGMGSINVYDPMRLRIAVVHCSEAPERCVGRAMRIIIRFRAGKTGFDEARGLLPVLQRMPP
jgi:hypothetical protein